MLPLDGYVRVSSVGGREGEGFISPDEQERAIREWSERTGTPVVVQPHELDVSGGTMDRPIFNSILDRIRRGESGGVVVFKTDRFARSLVGALNTLAEIGKHQGAFASTTEPNLDYASASGKAFLHMLFVFAEFTRDSLKESWATTQRNAIERGIHISPSDDLGYDKGPDGRRVPNQQAAITREVFLRRPSGESWDSIANWLDAAAQRPDGKLWTGQAVQRLCAKRVYRGEAFRYVHQDVDGRGAIVNPDAHPALVSEAEWHAAQAAQARVGGTGNGESGLLAGQVRCAGCRHVMSPGRDRRGERTYGCRPKKTTGRCAAPSTIMAERIEEHVEAMVLAEIDAMVKIAPSSADRDEAVQQLALARADLDAFRADTAARRKLGDEQWHQWLDSHLQAVRQAEGELDRLNAHEGLATVGMARDHYLSLPTADRREVLGGFLDAVIVRRSRGRGRNTDPIDTRVKVLWRGQGPADLPRRRVASPIVAFDFDADDVVAGVAAG